MTDGVLNYGNGSAGSMAAAIENFPGAAINGFSFACTPIELLSNDTNKTILHTATGFYWLRNGRPYLVTNWHVVSGRNPFTREVLDATGYIPRAFTFHGLSTAQEGMQIRFVRSGKTFSWNDDIAASFENPPEIDGSVVDLWAIPVEPGTVFRKSTAQQITCFLNDYDFRPIVTTAGDDCFILGYPLRNYAGLMPPIWRRGSIAGDTNIGLDNKPAFLIDAASTPGMSGSPIIRRSIGAAVVDNGTGHIREVASYSILGVYAGRLQNTKLEATNLGYGWYATMIDRVIDYYNYPGPPATTPPN